MSFGRPTDIVLGEFEGLTWLPLGIREAFLEEVMFGLELGGRGGFRLAEMGGKKILWERHHKRR